MKQTRYHIQSAGAAESSIHEDGRVRSEAGLEIDHASCRTGVRDEPEGTEQWDGSRETYLFRDSGIARRYNSTGKVSCIGLLKSVDTNGDEIGQGSLIEQTHTMAKRRLESDSQGGIARGREMLVELKSWSALTPQMVGAADEGNLDQQHYFVDVSARNQWRPTARIWCRCVEQRPIDRCDLGSRETDRELFPRVILPSRPPPPHFFYNFNKTQLEMHLEVSNLHVGYSKNMFILAST